MPNPRDHRTIGGQDIGRSKIHNRPSASAHGIVYHCCGGRFNVDTWTNRKSNQRQREQAVDPATACVGHTCEGCGKPAEYSDLATVSTLEARYPGLPIGEAIRRWQKSRKKARKLAAAAQLPNDPSLYEQKELF